MKTYELVEMFIREEQYVTSALRSCEKQLTKGVDMVASALKKNGRLFYVGAGTSGRLGVLDASEIPPTFGESPDRVQAIIAGGTAAIHRSVEGAEDYEEEGALAVQDRGLRKRDIVCGITASGQTPFVMGALKKAKSIGSKTILLTCNPHRKKMRIADLEIDMGTGPELIAGSTRLKAGTATKVALNLLSTCVMIRLKKSRGNLMTHLTPGNIKLRERAVRIVSGLLKCSREEALRLLVQNQWNVQKTISREID
jgi:N-acetylmuramic acid 6-phosphate etherase